MPEQAKQRRIKKLAAPVRSRIKKDDMVMVVTGRERGKTGKVMRVLALEGRVIVERLNVMKRHSKPRGPQSPGGIVEKEAPLPISNVMFFCERCNAPVRVGIKPAADGARVRACRRCGEQIGNE
ncbi:MAG TPA: 50S ribosomal protein L24 [Candidatus Binataceae bacterium]|nr:50S ribosomal protein L24 [Candidatus Binataceae bacterium]HVB80074.1 50S ribosomal protein L24 [Candidatus Binataceae bacterium]